MEAELILASITAARRSLAGIFAGKRFPDRAAWKLAAVARECADEADAITAGSITCAVARYEAALMQAYKKDKRELRNSSEELLALLEPWTAKE